MGVTKTTKKSGFYRMPDNGLGYYFGRKAASGRIWGQGFLILFLIELGERWFAIESGHPYGIGDIANEDGSIMADHISHSGGSAVDLYTFHKNGVRRNDKSNIVSYKDTDIYDRDRTLRFLQLIKEFSTRWGMIQILYNDNSVNAEVNKAGGWPPVTDDSKTKKSKGQHDEHIHITFNGKAPYSPKQIVEILENKQFREVSRSYFSIDMCGIR